MQHDTMHTYRVDLHVHTIASPDGRSTIEEIAVAAKRAGLDAIAICDHDRCTPVPDFQAGVLLIPGCEVSTRAGHITALFLERPIDLAALGTLPAPEAAVTAIRRAGGLAVIAHPFYRPGKAAEDFAFDLDGVETANARASFKAADANERAAALAQARGLPAVGGSDAHDAKEVGNAYTELTAPALTLPALRKALLDGRSRAVLVKNTPHIRKGLSQWTKARRTGRPGRLVKAAAYLAYCVWLDMTRRH
nr:PHP domain-containing protein [uncultured Agathobaculum sp.]